MAPHTQIRPPFFEIGPKAYLAGDEVLALAKAADAAAREHDVQVLFTAPFLELAAIAKATTNLVVLAPHMDAIERGRGTAAILPESLVAAGANGVQLNHCERPLTYAELEASIAKAREHGLITMVCANSVAEIKAVALLGPDVIVAEPTELIGTGTTSDLSYMQAAAEAAHAIDPRIRVLQAAGISGGDDVERVLRMPAADGTGSSSGIAKADDPSAMAVEMIAAARRGFDARTQTSTINAHPLTQGAAS